MLECFIEIPTSISRHRKTLVKTHAYDDVFDVLFFAQRPCGQPATLRRLAAARSEPCSHRRERRHELRDSATVTRQARTRGMEVSLVYQYRYQEVVEVFGLCNRYLAYRSLQHLRSVLNVSVAHRVHRLCRERQATVALFGNCRGEFSNVRAIATRCDSPELFHRYRGRPDLDEGMRRHRGNYEASAMAAATAAGARPKSAARRSACVRFETPNLA